MRSARHVGTALLLAPSTLFLVLCFILPLVRFLSLAFTGDGGFLRSFSTLFESRAYRIVFLNTLCDALLVSVITLVLAWPVAYVLSRAKGRKLALLFYCVLFPFWISVLVRAFAWMLLLERTGPINRTLVFLGVIREPLPLLFNHTGVVIGMVHVLLPYAVIPLYSAMKRIDHRLLLASESIGAGLIYSFFRIYLPLVLPGAVGAAIVVLLISLGFFVTPALLGGAEAITLSTLISTFVTERLAWSLAAASSIVLLLVVLAMFLIVQRLLPLRREALGE